MENKKDLKELFKSFLIHLNEFIDLKAVVEDAEIRILYLQEPEDIIDEYISRGAIKLENAVFPIEVDFDYKLNVIKVNSEIFRFHLTLQQMLDFLKERGGGV